MLADTSQTRLGRALAAGVVTKPGGAGIHRRLRGAAGPARRAAERSLDAQCYIWHGDLVGYLLFEALPQAPGRGVRVYMLLDDLDTGGLDATMAARDAHPNIEVRLYSPVVERNACALNVLSDFARVNRRTQVQLVSILPIEWLL